jgi:hypothetical protein
MILEKTFVLPTGRAVKVITKTTPANEKSYNKTDLDVLIREPKEEDFRPPIGKTHPQYWKLKKLTAQESKLIEIQYSGLSDKQIRNALKEFEKIHASMN